MAARSIHSHKQSGVFLLEALIAILIFSLGILGMIAMGSAAIAGQTDAAVRTDAASLAEQLASKIALGVDRTSDATLATSLAAFSHNPLSTGPYCAFTPAASAAPVVTAWLATLSGPSGLPGAGAADQSIVVDTSAAGYNSVLITMCWKGPHDLGKRRFMTTVYVNR